MFTAFLAKAFANLAVHGPQMITDGEAFFAAVVAEFETIAHGEGGLKKVQAAAGHLADVAAAAAKVAGDVVG